MGLKTDGWMQCIENSACLYPVPQTNSISGCQCIQKPLATNSKQVTGCELCTVWANRCFVCDGVHPGGLGGGGGGAGSVTWRQCPAPSLPDTWDTDSNRSGGSCVASDSDDEFPDAWPKQPVYANRGQWGAELRYLRRPKKHSIARWQTQGNIRCRFGTVWAMTYGL